eukprot:scaffold11_cov257-Pinguiococcus_pyrenoidosus.AAC.67
MHKSLSLRRFAYNRRRRSGGCIGAHPTRLHPNSCASQAIELRDEREELALHLVLLGRVLPPLEYGHDTSIAPSTLPYKLVGHPFGTTGRFQLGVKGHQCIDHRLQDSLGVLVEANLFHDLLSLDPHVAKIAARAACFDLDKPKSPHHIFARVGSLQQLLRRGRFRAQPFASRAMPSRIGLEGSRLAARATITASGESWAPRLLDDLVVRQRLVADVALRGGFCRICSVEPFQTGDPSHRVPVVSSVLPCAAHSWL